MLISKNLAGMAAVVVLLSGCGGTNSSTSTVTTSTARGTLIQDPPFRVASLNAADLSTQLSGSTAGQQLLQITGAPTCGVDVYDFQYYTVGAQGETTTASGALMVPTGASGTCSGPRPVVLYAHGTQPDKAANLANITDSSNTEGVMIAAMFAAQGYIVVAPNYAGYDISTLPYHPFLNADQQSKDMIDSLAAARTALPKIFSAATSDSGKLFITGYSQGGYVAMATEKAMQTAGTTVTAAAPMSGPYALAAFGDLIMYGGVNIGSTVFVPMIVTSYQEAYGNIFSSISDIYSSTYTGNSTFSGANGNVLPSTTSINTLFSSGVLPETALLNSTTPVFTTSMGLSALQAATLTAALAVPSSTNFPTASAGQLAIWDLGFGNPSLVNNSFRQEYILDAAVNPDGLIPSATTGMPATSPALPLRIALKTNDLRGFVPTSPTLLCGGDQDPTVYYSVNTGAMQGLWTAGGLGAPLVNYVDVNATPSLSDPFAAVETAFQETLVNINTAAGGGVAGETAVVENYHATVAPFCAVVARSFFSQFL